MYLTKTSGVMTSYRFFKMAAPVSEIYLIYFRFWFGDVGCSSLISSLIKEGVQTIFWRYPTILCFYTSAFWLEIAYKFQFSAALRHIHPNDVFNHSQLDSDQPCVETRRLSHKAWKSVQRLIKLQVKAILMWHYRIKFWTHGYFSLHRNQLREVICTHTVNEMKSAMF